MSHAGDQFFNEIDFRREYFQGGLEGAFWAALLGALSYIIFIIILVLKKIIFQI